MPFLSPTRFFLLSVALNTCAGLVAVAEEATEPGDGLTASEMSVEAPSGQDPKVVLSPENSPLRLTISAEASYPNERGEELVDVLEQEYVYLTVKLETSDGIPVAGVEPKVSITGNSRIMLLTALANGQNTDADGLFDFAVIGGKMGLDRITVSAADVSAELLVNVISLEAAGFADPQSVEGALSWKKLTQAKISYREDGSLLAEILPEIEARNGQRVKLAGFMVPLEAERKQKHFLLTSNPPSCFFHTPGGPAGAVEVFAKKGVTADWEMLVLEGRLETLKSSDDGTVYRLHDAVITKE